MPAALLQLLETTRRIGSWSVDIQSSTVAWSPMTYEIHEEDPNKRIELAEAINYYIPEHRPLISQCMQESKDKRQTWDIQLQICTARGNVRWIHAAGQPSFDGDELIRVQGIFEDIDERKQLELERESLLKRMLEGERIANIGHWTWDIASNTVEWTLGVYRMFGVDPSKPPPDLDAQTALIHPDDRKSFRQTLEHAAMAATEYTVSFRVRVDGHERHIRGDGFPRFGEDGKLTGFAGVAIDRTHDRERELQIEELNRRLTLALEASRIGVWEWNVVTDELIWDDEMYALYGVNRESFSGAYAAWEQGLHPDDKEDAVSRIQHAVETRGKFEAKFRVCWPNGTVHIISDIAKLALDENDQPIKMVGVNWDITEEVRIRSELERSNQELVEFAYRTSHDLKSPLTAVRRLAECVIEDARAGELDEAERNIAAIGQRARAMETMIQSVLSSARADLDDSPAEPIDLETLVRDLVTEHSELIERKSVLVRHSIEADCKPALPQIRVRQLIANLLQNGIKYAHPERAERLVDISIRVRNGSLEVRVEDNGCGMPTKDARAPYQIFRRFHSGEAGSGLGLYIVKKHVESMAGHISHASSDEGTRFDVVIPLPSTQKVHPPTQPVSP
ncbi:MAG: PAS domain-containing protein [Planctomycetota bacterium]